MANENQDGFSAATLASIAIKMEVFQLLPKMVKCEAEIQAGARMYDGVPYVQHCESRMYHWKAKLADELIFNEDLVEKRTKRLAGFKSKLDNLIPKLDEKSKAEMEYLAETLGIEL